MSFLRDTPLISQNRNVLFPRLDAVNGLLDAICLMSQKAGSELPRKGHNLFVKQTCTRIPMLQLLATRIASSPNTCLLTWKSRHPYVSQHDGSEEDAENRWLIPIPDASHASGAEQTLVDLLTNFYTPEICDTISIVKNKNRAGFPKVPQKCRQTSRNKKKRHL